MKETYHGTIGAFGVVAARARMGWIFVKIVIRITSVVWVFAVIAVVSSKVCHGRNRVPVVVGPSDRLLLNRNRAKAGLNK